MLWGIAISALVPLATEIFRFFNNMIEGEPPEIRTAKAIALFAALKPLGKFIDADARVAIENLMDQLIETTSVKAVTE